MACSSLRCLPLLFISLAAHAQYAPHSLGLSPNVSSALGTRSAMYGVTIEFSNYLESSFEFFARVPILIAEVSVGADTADGSGRVFSTGGSLGVRYLFLESAVRPWVGLQLSGVVLVTKPDVTWFLGAGPSVGVEWVLDESWSIGARGVYDVFIDLNRPWRHQLGASLNVSVLF